MPRSPARRGRRPPCAARRAGSADCRPAVGGSGACPARTGAPASWIGRSRFRGWPWRAPARAPQARCGAPVRPERCGNRPWGRGLSLSNLREDCQSASWEGAPAGPRLQSPAARNSPVSPLPGRETELASDHEALDLARALADLQDLRVAVEASDGKLLHEAVAPVDLDRLARRVDGGLARRELRDRGLGLEGPSDVAEPRRSANGEARVLHRDLHVGDLELHRLVRADLTSERGTFPRVGDALVETRLREP